MEWPLVVGAELDFILGKAVNVPFRPFPVGSEGLTDEVLEGVHQVLPWAMSCECAGYPKE